MYYRSSSRLSELSSCCIFSCSFSNTPLRLCLSAAIRFVCWENASGLFHCVGHTVVGSHHSCHPATKHQERVSEDIAGFVIPLCATIHLSGSTLKIVACALALMMMQGMPFDFPMFAGFIFMLGITMVAAPGVPGGAIMAALGILSSMLGFGESEQALMIALYIAMDSFGTACNVTGDGAIALIIDKFFGKK